MEEAEIKSQEKVEEKAEEKKEEKKAVPEKFKDLVAKIENLSVLELNELVKSLESHFGVSAAAMAGAPAAGGGEAVAEGPAMVTVHLKSAGAQKVQVIKAIKEALTLGLKEAKDLVDAAPSVLKENVPKDEADKLKQAITAVGGEVEFK